MGAKDAKKMQYSVRKVHRCALLSRHLAHLASSYKNKYLVHNRCYAQISFSASVSVG